MVEMNKHGWHEFLLHELKRLHFDARAALESMGLRASEQLRESILMGDWDGLAESTIKRKGFDTPLIDSHNMLNAVDYAVVNK